MKNEVTLEHIKDFLINIGGGSQTSQKTNPLFALVSESVDTDAVFHLNEKESKVWELGMKRIHERLEFLNSRVFTHSAINENLLANYRSVIGGAGDIDTQYNNLRNMIREEGDSENYLSLEGKVNLKSAIGAGLSYEDINKVYALVVGRKDFFNADAPAQVSQEDHAVMIALPAIQARLSKNKDLERLINTCKSSYDTIGDSATSAFVAAMKLVEYLMLNFTRTKNTSVV